MVFPGAVATNIATNSGVQVVGGAASEASKPSFKALPASKAAQIIVEGKERNRFRVLVGPDARMMDLLYRLSRDVRQRADFQPSRLE